MKQINLQIIEATINKIERITDLDFPMSERRAALKQTLRDFHALDAPTEWTPIGGIATK